MNASPNDNGNGAQPAQFWVGLGLALLAGPVGLVIFGFVVLVRMQPPRTMSGQAWRLLGLCACSAAIAAGAIGGLVGLALGWDYPPTLVFAVIEGGVIAGAPGFVLGALVGVVVALNHVRQAKRA